MPLREVLPSDLPVFYEHQADPDALRMAGMPGRDRGTFVTHWQTTVLGQPSVVVRTVLHEGNVAGTINTFESEGRRLLGYFFGKAYWGKGVATLAIREFLKLETSRPLFAFVSNDNLGSLRALEKNGFTRVEEIPNRLGDGITDVLLKLARPRVALVTSSAFPHLYEDDLLLVAALEEISVDSRPAVWSDPTVDWLAFDALVIRSPWDYFERLDEFRPWLDARIASGVRMCNSSEIIDWNFDKRYLQDLAAAGVLLVPTIVVPRGESPDIVALARARGWEEIVVKPTISGGAYGTHRFRLDAADEYRDDIARTLSDRGLLIQPFLPEILSAGELSLLFFDGVFSHAVCKRPKVGDYRVQFVFGGTSETVDVRDEWIAEARACIAAAPALPVYARVDGVIQDGKFLLMEFEVFEPLMFLNRHPLAAGRFARAIRGRLTPN